MSTRSVLVVVVLAVVSTAAIMKGIEGASPICAEAPYFAHMGHGTLEDGQASIALPNDVFVGADPEFPMPLLVTPSDKSEELHAWVDVDARTVEVRSKRGQGGGGDSRFSWLLLVPKPCGHDDD